MRFARAETPECGGEPEDFLGAGRYGDDGLDGERADAPRRPADVVAGGAQRHRAGRNYGPDFDPLGYLAQKERGAISVYAQGDDYHDVIKKKLKRLAGYIAENSAPR